MSLLPPVSQWGSRLTFSVSGACILLPWNSEIVASVYFAARLADSPFKYSFISFLTLTFNLGNLAFLAHANATQLEVRHSNICDVSLS